MMDAPLIGAFGFPRPLPVMRMLVTGGLNVRENSPLSAGSPPGDVLTAGVDVHTPKANGQYTTV